MNILRRAGQLVDEYGDTWTYTMTPNQDVARLLNSPIGYMLLAKRERDKLGVVSGLREDDEERIRLRVERVAQDVERDETL